MKNFCLLKSFPVEYDTRADDNHIFIHTLAADKDYSLAVNVQSNMDYSRLYYCINEYNINDRLAREISDLKKWYKMDEGIYTSHIHLNYDNGWVDKNSMMMAEDKTAYHTRRVNVDNNHFAAELVRLIEECISDPDSFILATGVFWGPKDERDWTFGFKPAMGLHDIHDNDGVYDGAIFFCHKDGRVTGVYTDFIDVD